MTPTEKKALIAFLKSERKGMGSDRDGYASGYKRAVDRAVAAVNAIDAGKVYDAASDAWVDPA